MKQDLNPISIRASVMRWLGLTFMGLCILLVTGCGTMRTETITVTKTEYVSTPVPAAFTTALAVPAPPSQEEFLSADQTGQIELLRKYILKLLPVIKNSNDDRKKLRKWSDEITKQKDAAEKKQDLIGDLLQSKESNGGK